MTARTRGLASPPAARISRNDRTELTRSAVFLIFLIVVLAVGNLHVIKGPGDFNVYGYFYVRLHWTGFGFQANLVEEYVLLSALLHDSVSLERTWDQELSPGLMSGQLNLAITGLMFTIHLFLFRFADTEPCTLRSPPTLINWYPSWLITLKFFWTGNTHVPFVPVRDIFLNKYNVLKNPVWCGFYIMAVVIFMTHAAEFDMIHPPDVVEKHAPDASVHLEMEEREMTKKMIPQKEAAPWKKWRNTTRKAMCGWCWSLHPGGELAIPTFAGKDAATFEKHATDAIRGVVGNGKAKKAKGAAKLALHVATDKGDPVATLEAWGAFDDTPGVLLVNSRS